MKKRVCSLALALTICLGLVPGMAAAADQPRQVGADVQGEEIRPLERGNSLPVPEPGADGSVTLGNEEGVPYELQKDMTITGPICIKKSVELILPAGRTLTAEGGIEGGGTLVISARSGSTGTLSGGEDNTLRISGVYLIANGGQVCGTSSAGHGIDITDYGALEVDGGTIIGETTCTEMCGIYSHMFLAMKSGIMQVSAVNGCGVYGGTDGLTIEGGLVDAARSGGVAGDAVTISGGIVIGDVSVSGKMGQGPEQVFSTNSGDAWIISNKQIDIISYGPPDLSKHSGFFTIGNVTEVWGNQVLPEQLPEELGPEPEIKVCGTLTIPEGRRFVNEGCVVVCHDGKLINNGIVDNTRGLLQEEGPKVTFKLAEDTNWEKPSLTQDKIVYALRSAEQKIFTNEQPPTFSEGSRLELDQLPKVKFDQPYVGGRWSTNGTIPADITQLTIRDQDHMVFTVVPETEFAEISWSEQGPVITTMFGLQFEGTLFAAGYADGRQVAVAQKAMGPYESVLISEPEFQKADTVKVFWLDSSGVPLYRAVSAVRGA